MNQQIVDLLINLPSEIIVTVLFLDLSLEMDNIVETTNLCIHFP